jgi:hypothetical protein
MNGTSIVPVFMAGALWLGGTSMSAVSAAPNSLEIAQGQVGQVNLDHVGVAWIADDGSAAIIVVAGQTGGTAWEVRTDVRAGDTVPVGRGLARAAIRPARGTDHGSVTLMSIPASADVPMDAVLVPAGGRLRLDGPSVLTATDMTPSEWRPDEARPTEVIAEWLPARVSKEAPPPDEIRRQTLRPGITARIGENDVTVAGITGAADHRRGCLVLRLAHR